ncbi:MAG: cytochrome c oxidase subunit 3 [Flavobacteriales bacterium]|nr:cytochrome c oxidase subunit 3 [Flavobacteriales bacterium]
MEENKKVIDIVALDKKAAYAKSAKPLLYVGMGSMSMAFAGLISAAIVTMGEPTWIRTDIPDAFTTSSIVILISSITMWFTQYSATKDNQQGIRIGIIATFLLGVAFIYSQVVGYGQLFDDGVVFAGSVSYAAGSYIYVLSGLHIAHLVGGLVVSIVVMIRAFMNLYSSKVMLGIELCSIFWHFLGGLWLLLYFVLIYLS